MFDEDLLVIRAGKVRTGRKGYPPDYFRGYGSLQRCLFSGDLWYNSYPRRGATRKDQNPRDCRLSDASPHLTHEKLWHGGQKSSSPVRNLRASSLLVRIRPGRAIHPRSLHPSSVNFIVNRNGCLDCRRWDCERYLGLKGWFSYQIYWAHACNRADAWSKDYHIVCLR